MTLTRRGLGRALTAAVVAAPDPRAAVSRHGRPGADPAGVRIGIALPDSLGPPDTCAGTSSRFASLGVQVVELGGRTIDQVLGAPDAPALWLPSAGEALAGGLLAIEEEMLEDERDLARRAFAAQLRGWRSSASLAPLVPFRARASEAGMRIELVRWNGLAVMADDEIDYSLRAARSLGAASVSTAFSIDGIARLAARAGRHRMRVGLCGGNAIDAADYEAAFREGSAIGAALDVAAWIAGGHGSPVAFLAQHADRITHVAFQVAPANDGSERPFGEADAAVRDVLQQMRDRHWPFPAIIRLADEAAAADGVTVADGSGDQGCGIGDPLEPEDQWRVLEHAIAYCRSCLSG